ncbi:hypothetical protein H113_05141 [Trichophyton rubrum MR1459]|uniref:Uncharacterized protein n=1 Tax=Trichophyton rubrum (strain ATCC MYA-4607 / CBS 118892) TaxID=559305 RepID=A0A080WFC7_TRIRC|nr:uncharacterized protein TERG_11910 [Trichophyton rubrum CBS 118892]EZF94206.1 hypothetical protein H113_05141 [Trichophyton rubrum MR1459]EZG05181.1 hypothetical protein H106_04940 [Trichophyton rubrum CBS 735.88]KFL60981.1 hypothetical protein TERG_11910 [Trichophyton rubrum CBS 118892]
MSFLLIVTGNNGVTSWWRKSTAGLPLERGALPLYQGLPVVPVNLRYVDGRLLGGAREDKISPRIPDGCNSSSSGREVLVEHGRHLGRGRRRAPIPASAAEFSYRCGLGCVLEKMRGGLGYG